MTRPAARLSVVAPPAVAPPVTATPGPGSDQASPVDVETVLVELARRLEQAVDDLGLDPEG